MPTPKEALLFVSKMSIFFQATLSEFEKIIAVLEKSQPFHTRVIDVDEEPDMAEKHKVDALPTLIIGNKRFVGRPNVDTIVPMIEKS
jgi:hypothetical protein